MALRVRLAKSYAGAPADQVATIAGLGLKRINDVRLLRSTDAVRGMIFKVKHLVVVEEVSGEAPVRQRAKPRKDTLRSRARAAERAEN